MPNYKSEETLEGQVSFGGAYFAVIDGVVSFSDEDNIKYGSTIKTLGFELVDESKPDTKKSTKKTKDEPVFVKDEVSEPVEPVVTETPAAE